jgi:hypothetical protein
MSRLLSRYYSDKYLHAAGTLVDSQQRRYILGPMLASASKAEPSEAVAPALMSSIANVEIDSIKLKSNSERDAEVGYLDMRMVADKIKSNLVAFVERAM